MKGAPVALLGWGAAILLGGCNFSLAQDLTPPPGSELSAEGATTATVAAPPSAPDAARGEVLYLENCAPCHGLSGLGDGEQSGELPVAPPPIGSAELAAASTPADWFRVVSEGNLERFMPPFAGSLSEQARWDVLAYVYQLSGEFALSPDGQLVEAVSAPPLEDAGDGELPAALDIEGSVANGSGGDLPSGAEVTLYAYDHSQELFTRMTTLGEDGRFRFEEVPLGAENLYLASIEYKGLIYFSEPLAAQGMQAGGEFALTVYEGGQDTSGLEISSLNLVFDFLAEDKVKVVEQVLLSNRGNRAVVPAEGGEALLQYALPERASNLSFEQGGVGERYELVEGGFADYRAVLPGRNTYQVLFAYDLPYEAAVEYGRRVDFPARAVHVFLPQSEVEMAADEFVFAGEQLIEGVVYRVYELEGELQAGEQIQIALSGPHPLREDFFARVGDDQFLVGLGALTLSVALAWFWLRRPQPGSEAPGEIMDAIIALDEAQEKGALTRSRYQRERERLKQRLQQALDRRESL